MKQEKQNKATQSISNQRSGRKTTKKHKGRLNIKKKKKIKI